METVVFNFHKLKWIFFVSFIYFGSLERYCLMYMHLSFLGGLRAILTDQNKLVVAVGGVTALAAGIYTTR